MKRSFTPRSLASVAVALSVSFAASLQAAQAQSFYNLPYYFGSSLVYPLSRVLFGSGSSIYNMSNPYYLTNRMVNGQVNSSGIFRAPGYGQMPAGINNSYVNSNGSYNQQYGYNQPDPNGNVQPDPNGQPTVLQSTGALGGTYYTPQQAQFPVQQQQYAANQYSNTAPPLAPQSLKKLNKLQRKQQKLQQQVAQVAPNAVSNPAPMPISNPLVSSPAPLAQGFVSMVNSKYDGDISKALFSAEGRSWAKSVGLIESNDIFGADLSAERVGVIGKIFKDPGLDAASKLDAAKILLRTTGPATPIAGSAK